jgi:sugar phosphate isomerase/epimerase
MTTRRQAISALGMAGMGTLMPSLGQKSIPLKESGFLFCLNTVSVSKQGLGLQKYIEIASAAGYDGIEVWIRDVEQYFESGNTALQLKRLMEDHHIQIENAIGFAPWFTGGKTGFDQMKKEMEMMALLGCRRIAAPIVAPGTEKPFDLFEVGLRYRELIALGRETGVMPQLEFWGASKVFWHIGQAMMVVAAANDPDARILADVYHMYRGNSGYESLKMLDGKMIEIFHMNDFVSSIPREEQKDSDRVYPGDGAAPFKQIIADLKQMGGIKVLSIELFNEEYWKNDPLSVAKTGLEKMKNLV